MDSARTQVDDDPGKADRLLFRRLGERLLTPPEPGQITVTDERPATMLPEDSQLRQTTAETAHDFNNLLSVILSCASELESGAAAETSRERGAEIRAAAERGAALARKLIETAKPTERTTAPLDLNGAIEESRRTLERALGERIHLTLERAPGIPSVLLLREELDRVLLNLASNARDALDDSGSFALRTALVNIDDGDPVLRPGWHVRLQASDDGPGMSPTVRVRALEPFYTTKGQTRGNGLGLPTVAGIARSRGGDVRIASVPGQGTTIAVYLPAVRTNGDALALPLDS